MVSEGTELKVATPFRVDRTVDILFYLYYIACGCLFRLLTYTTYVIYWCFHFHFHVHLLPTITSHQLTVLVYTSGGHRQDHTLLLLLPQHTSVQSQEETTRHFFFFRNPRSSLAMDFKSFGRNFQHGGALHQSNMTGGNATVPGLEPIIALLGARNPLVQIIMVLHSLVGSRLGLDPTMFLTLLGFLWASNRIWYQPYNATRRLVSDYLVSSISVASGDEIYLHLMKWLASQPKLVNSRALSAETLSKTAWEEEEENETDVASIGADGAGVYLNFSNQEAKMAPRFLPALGTHRFWFRGTFFWLDRARESFLEDAEGMSAAFKDRENLVISCLGRSPAPIKALLRLAKEEYYNDHHAKTVIKRPLPAGSRRFGRSAWAQVANRPVRPMKTVVLDAKQKIQVLADINEYLHPATPRWYANRGIPLRRGYLFHGPPGTGKTSLSFALAGVFGLDIFVISLLEPTLTEEDMLALFNSLPRRCVVLLEDIDTAGLARTNEEKEEEAQSKQLQEDALAAKNTTTATTNGETNNKDGGEGTETNGGRGSGGAGGRRRKPGANGGGGRGETENGTGAGGPSEWKVADLARELKRGPWSDEKKGISLSGLLNAIDGVASHEGRVLIMTTNKPETLDDALIRPGRVDLQVAFTNATQEQSRELFERMYEADSRPQQSSGGSSSSKAVEEDEKWSSAANGHAKQTETEKNGGITTPRYSGALGGGDEQKTADGELAPLTLEQLRTIAAEFAAKIPDGHFSPAELQGFLLKRKKDPRKAVDEVGPWVDAMMRLKASKTKIIQVQ